MFSAWSGLGAPLIEGFEDSSPELVECNEDDGFTFKMINDKKKAMYWMKTLGDYAPISNGDCEINFDNEVIMCPSDFKNKVKKEYDARHNDDDSNELGTESDSEDESESDSDEEEETAKQEEEDENSRINQNNNSKNNNNNNNNTTTTTQANDLDDESDDSNDENNDGIDNDDLDDDSDDETSPTTAGSEPFFGGKIEHFTNNGDTASKVLSLNLFLKSIMIACLFYILAHPDTKKFILSKVFKNIKPEYYLYVAMLLFFVVFYIIGIFL